MLKETGLTCFDKYLRLGLAGNIYLLEPWLLAVFAQRSLSLPAGELFAQAPIEQYPGLAVETVADSSRYFVIRIQDGTGKGFCMECSGT